MIAANMICRVWRGWTSLHNADTYERIVRHEVIPEIEGRRIEGFEHIDLMRRPMGEEVEFATIMWFRDLNSIKRFTGEDYEVSHVPAAARAVLARYDQRATHYQVLDRRPQRGNG